MTRTAPSGRTASRAPVGLDADAILRAALELLDEDGVDALTIRRLSARLGVTGPTIYWHMGNKAQLKEAIVNRVLTDIDLASNTAGTWEDRLRAFLAAAREQLVAHPGVLELTRSTVPPAVERWSVKVLHIMQDAGFDDANAALYARIALWHVMGFARVEADIKTGSPIIEAVDSDTDESRYRVRPELISPDTDPTTALMATVDLNEQHEAVTEMFVAGVRAALDATGSEAALARLPS